MHLAPDEWIGVHETRRAHPDASHTHRLILDGLIPIPPPFFVHLYFTVWCTLVSGGLGSTIYTI